MQSATGTCWPQLVVIPRYCHLPPAYARTTITSKSPSEAIFINIIGESYVFLINQKQQTFRSRQSFSWWHPEP
jgi:hypothetical protein